MAGRKVHKRTPTLNHSTLVPETFSHALLTPAFPLRPHITTTSASTGRLAQINEDATGCFHALGGRARCFYLADGHGEVAKMPVHAVDAAAWRGSRGEVCAVRARLHAFYTVDRYRWVLDHLDLL